MGIQQEYEKIKHQLEKERDECNLTIRELRKANEKYQIEIELKNEKIQSIVNSGNHQIETHQRHQEVDQERQKFEDAANQAIENLKALLEQEKSIRRSKEDQIQKLDHLLSHNQDQHHQIISELEKQLNTLKSHVEICDGELHSVRNNLESKNLKLKKLEREYDLAVDQLHQSRNDMGSYKQQLHDLNLTIENLKTELHHSHRGSGRIQQEYEKIKHQLEKERDECNLTIRELRKANEK